MKVYVDTQRSDEDKQCKKRIYWTLSKCVDITVFNKICKINEDYFIIYFTKMYLS
jgi:hypothetical protein